MTKIYWIFIIVMAALAIFWTEKVFSQTISQNVNLFNREFSRLQGIKFWYLFEESNFGNK